MSGRLLARNAAALAASRAVGGGASFLLLALAGRKLEVADFGLFSWLVGVTAVLTVACDFGLDQLLVRDASVEPRSLRLLARRAVGLKLSISAVVGLVAYLVLTSARSPASSQALATALILGSLPLLVVAHTAWFCADPAERMHLRAAQAALFETLRLGLGAAALILGLGVAGLCGAWLVGSAAAACVGAVAAGRLGGSLAPLPPHLGLARRALPFAGFQLESVGLLNVPMAVLGWVAGREAAGFYGGALVFFLGMWLFAAALSDALFPRLSRAEAGPWRLSAATLGASILLVAVLLPLRGAAVRLVFGEPRPVTEAALLWLLPAAAFASVQPLVSKTLMAGRRTVALAVFDGLVLLGLALTCWAFAALGGGAVGVAKAVLLWRGVEAAGLVALARGWGHVRDLRNPLA